MLQVALFSFSLILAAFILQGAEAAGGDCIFEEAEVFTVHLEKVLSSCIDKLSF